MECSVILASVSDSSNLCRDLELIKVKLLEEVEGPYKHKCDLLAQVRG